MTYVDGFVLAVPAANKETYRKYAADAAPLFKEFGAQRMVECWGDDVPDGELTDFRGAVKAKDDEVVLFSWIEYPSKDVRDAANSKMMTDPRMQEMGSQMPFDGMRMIYGGFAVLADGAAQARMGYADGAVIAVPEDNKGAYAEFSSHHADILKEYGATRVVDAWDDDVPNGKVTDFKGAVKAKAGEKIVYSWVEWPSKTVRDEAWGKVMSDPRMVDSTMPFDGKRMVHGGFAPILDV